MRDTKSNAFRLATTLGGAICVIALVASPIAFDSATLDLDGKSAFARGGRGRRRRRRPGWR